MCLTYKETFCDMIRQPLLCNCVIFNIILEYIFSSNFNFKSPEKNLISYHMTDGRYYTQDLRNNMELPTLYKNNATLKVNRYSNGVVTVNCARIILPNQPATNGILHVIEKVSDWYICETFNTVKHSFSFLLIISIIKISHI